MLCNSNDTEKFDNVASADIEAIRNLNSIATKLTAGQLTNPGVLTSNGEVIGTMQSGVGQFRATTGGTGTILRQDGSTFYLLTTNKGDPNGGWNDKRPFYIDNASGNVTMAHSVSIGGNISAGGNIAAGGNMAIGGYGNVKATLDDIYARLNSIQNVLDTDSVKYSHNLQVWNEAHSAPLYACGNNWGGGACGGMAYANFYMGFKGNNTASQMKLVKV